MDLTSGMLNPAFLTLGVSQMVIGLLTVGFLACSILLILTVLIQRPQGGGLSGAFGAGAGSGETAFGAKTGDALTIATITFFVLWLCVAVGLVLVMSGTPAVQQPSGAASNEPLQGPVAPETGGDQTGGAVTQPEDGAGEGTGEGAGDAGETPPTAGDEEATDESAGDADGAGDEAGNGSDGGGAGGEGSGG